MKSHFQTVLVLFAIVMLMAGSTVNSQTTNSEADMEALRQVDIAWSKTVETQNYEQFYSYFLDDARMLAPDVPITEGITAIHELLDGFFGLPGFSLKWQPIHVEISASGELGFTIGTHVMTFDDPNGNHVVDQGKYLTIWKKSSDGTWKVFADIFNSTPSSMSTEEEEE